MNHELLQTLIIPDDLIFDHILPRLPVKSLIRFKSVCKNWYNLISTCEFAKHHLQFSSISPHFLISKFIANNTGNWRDFYLLSYDEHNKNLEDLVQLDAQLSYTMRKPTEIGCSNGLICLYFSENRYNVNSFALWNPCIRKYRKISTPSGKWLCKCGFGYALALDDYRIFAAFCPYEEDDSLDKSRTQFWVFSLRVGKWKQIEFSSGEDDLIKSEGIVKGVFAGDSLYWYVFKSGGSFQQRVVCFNLVDEKCREILVTVSPSEYIDFDCYEMKWCLSLLCRAHDQSYGVWILKQQDGNDSWEKLFSMPFTVGKDLLAFSPAGLCLVKHLQQLKLVDPTLEELEDSQGQKRQLKLIEHATVMYFDDGVYLKRHLKLVDRVIEDLNMPISPFVLGWIA
ncbi:F-box/kelch-repeat protein At3g23880-like [Chenopodium quinoa]|uniref:F-box/kelch-repeat protein At3g23880-like n=1 Tax=Chenopodium quinoa TaxID=63459 RepID=UPI000B7708D2|nr:F-box/kelch-repeat protein At3g23880-like [Chenopodium quinoa]